MSSNASQVLIQIAADPSNAEAGIKSFQTNFSQNLASLGLNLSQWAARGQASFKSAGGGLEAFTSGSRKQFSTLGTLLAQHRSAVAEWSKSVSGSFREVQTSAAGTLQSSLLQTFVSFDSALARNIGNARVWQKSIGQAFSQAAERTIAAIAQEAIVRAIYSTALGFLLLAEMDFSGAAQAFESAAVFGAVGGAAALASHALGGSSSGHRASGSGQKSSSSRTATTGKSGAKSAGAGQTVQVIFQGPVYGGQAGIDELTRKISQAVVERDVNLTAYTVVRQPATRAWRTESSVFNSPIYTVESEN